MEKIPFNRITMPACNGCSAGQGIARHRFVLSPFQLPVPELFKGRTVFLEIHAFHKVA
jgi:hypothetical protein